jgi:chromosome segregation ATPase
VTPGSKTGKKRVSAIEEEGSEEGSPFSSASGNGSSFRGSYGSSDGSSPAIVRVTERELALSQGVREAEARTVKVLNALDGKTAFLEQAKVRITALEKEVGAWPAHLKFLMGVKAAAAEVAHQAEMAAAVTAALTAAGLNQPTAIALEAQLEALRVQLADSGAETQRALAAAEEYKARDDATSTELKEERQHRRRARKMYEAERKENEAKQVHLHPKP